MKPLSFLSGTATRCLMACEMARPISAALAVPDNDGKKTGECRVQAEVA